MKRKIDPILLTNAIKECIDKSILCWLATVSNENMPNVSPKEIFNYYGSNSIIVANIASPQSVKNIKQNENVCLSLVDILVQKGYQIKGKASIVRKEDSGFQEMEKILSQMTKGEYPFSTIIKISIHQIKSIIAPKYILYPETTEKQQIESAKIAYGF
ncbi:MAG: pyridoxamine 5'-phosphate oxidase family protein [Saprospiraceae bacterium]